jgi:hypothetical protein
LRFSFFMAQWPIAAEFCRSACNIIVL